MQIWSQVLQRASTPLTKPATQTSDTNASRMMEGSAWVTVCFIPVNRIEQFTNVFKSTKNPVKPNTNQSILQANHSNIHLIFLFIAYNTEGWIHTKKAAPHSVPLVLMLFAKKSPAEMYRLTDSVHWVANCNEHQRKFFFFFLSQQPVAEWTWNVVFETWKWKP